MSEQPEAYRVATAGMPPNTIALSQMMRELSAQPGFTEAFLAQMQGGAKKAGPTLLTPDLVEEMRELIAGKDWHKLDRFPGWTMGKVTPAVGALSRVVADKNELSHAPEAVMRFLDLGPYGLDSAKPISLLEPSPLPAFSLDAVTTKLGAGLTRGDGASPLALEHADSQRLADLLNRLSLNGMDGVAHTGALLPSGQVEAPDDLMRNLQSSGHSVTVTDSRYFANFGHLHLNGQDVMMPFWIDTQIIVPNSSPARPLLVPVSHAEYEWHIRGPLVNADVSFYFGIDGKAEFRTMDELDQAWVMKRDAYTYTGADAVEVTRLASAIVRTYMRLHAAHPAAPFGGYYAFGVCQDVVAAIEMKLSGKTTLFPNTADASLFNDPRDAEINALIARLPKDRAGKPPEVERIFGSLPVGGSEEELAAVTIPGLGADLVAVDQAWTQGTLERTGERRRMRNWLYLSGAILTAGLLWFVRRTNRRRKGK